MNVLRHHDERVELESAFVAVPIESLQKEAHVVFDNEESSSFPGLESDEVRSGRREES